MTETVVPGRGHAGSTAERGRTDPRLYAGIGFVLVFLVGLVISLGMADTSWPTPATPATETVGFFTTNAASAAVNALAQALAAVSLLVFSSGLARTFGGRAAPQLLAAGVLAAGTLLVSASVIGTLTRSTLAGEPELASALYYLGFLAGGPAHVVAFAVLVGTTSVAGRRSARLPGWLTLLGFVASGLGLLAVLNFAVPLVPYGLFAPFIPAGRFLGFVFLLAAVPVLRRGRVNSPTGATMPGGAGSTQGDLTP